MNKPTKQSLYSEVDRLRNDLYEAMNGLDDKELFYKLAVHNPDYYHWYFEKEAEKQIFANYMPSEKANGVDYYITVN